MRLLAISDRASLAPSDLPAWLAALGRAQVDSVMLREKDLPDRDLFGLTRLARAALPRSVRLVVNGRIDVALAASADGVHLPSDGVPVAALRARFGAAPLIGRSTHTLAEVEAALAAGADYVTFGPVYAVPGKERYGPPAGLAELGLAAAVGIPVYALGGVTLERLGEVAAVGVAGVAGIRLFQGPDLAAVVASAHRSLSHA
ncbi:MAG TPA: thiamine phosphate synthase [Thermoanaerobaculia bacterium]